MGVHKRLACSEMVACQLSQRAPSNAEYITRARKLFAASAKPQKILFLATDDSQAIDLQTVVMISKKSSVTCIHMSPPKD